MLKIIVIFHVQLIIKPFIFYSRRISRLERRSDNGASFIFPMFRKLEVWFNLISPAGKSKRKRKKGYRNWNKHLVTDPLQLPNNDVI